LLNATGRVVGQAKRFAKEIGAGVKLAPRNRAHAVVLDVALDASTIRARASSDRRISGSLSRSIRSEIRNSTLSFPIWEGLLTARRATPFSTHCGRREIVHHSLSTLGLAPLNIKPSQDAEAQ
jgi:hypothetical protein